MLTSMEKMMHSTSKMNPNDVLETDNELMAQANLSPESRIDEPIVS